MNISIQLVLYTRLDKWKDMFLINSTQDIVTAFGRQKLAHLTSLGGNIVHGKVQLRLGL